MPNLFQIINGHPNKKLGFGLLLLIVVLISATLLRFVHWVKPETQPPLLTQVDGMIHLTSVSDLSTKTDTKIVEPAQTFGSSLYVIGVYPEHNDVFPAETVSLVYVRDSKRFVEIQYRPNRTLEQELASYVTELKESIVLSEGVNATLVQLRKTTYCKNPSNDFIQICQMTRVLMFEKNNQVVALFADGEWISDGELIMMAKSINLDE